MTTNKIIEILLNDKEMQIDVKLELYALLNKKIKPIEIETLIVPQKSFLETK